MRQIVTSFFAVLYFAALLSAQTPEIKFIADTLVVQADGIYESDPDLATLTFQISKPEKDYGRAYDSAAQSMRRIAELAVKNG